MVAETKTKKKSPLGFLRRKLRKGKGRLRRGKVIEQSPEKEDHSDPVDYRFNKIEQLKVDPADSISTKGDTDDEKKESLASPHVDDSPDALETRDVGQEEEEKEEEEEIRDVGKAEEEKEEEEIRDVGQVEEQEEEEEEQEEEDDQAEVTTQDEPSSGVMTPGEHSFSRKIQEQLNESVAGLTQFLSVDCANPCGRAGGSTDSEDLENVPDIAVEDDGAPEDKKEESVEDKQEDTEKNTAASDDLSIVVEDDGALEDKNEEPVEDEQKDTETIDDPSKKEEVVKPAVSAADGDPHDDKATAE